MSSRRVLITGAGSGLGQALALRYAKAGDRVACVDVSVERADVTACMLAGTRHLSLGADVASDEAMETLRADIDAAWGGLDVLINNAGIASGGTMTDTTMDEWRRVIDVDLFGVARGCMQFLPGMLRQGSGHIINTSSFAGLAGAPGIMTYGVAKAGVVMLSEQMRAEVHARGVRVSVICPSFFRTNLMDSVIGTGSIKNVGLRLMETSPDSLDSVADNVFAAAQRGQFLILPTKHEPLRWRLKRWFPNFYFRQILKLAAKTIGDKAS